MDEEIKKGDVVRLMGTQSPLMVVEHITDGDNGKNAHLVWFDPEQRLMRNVLPLITLGKTATA